MTRSHQIWICTQLVKSISVNNWDTIALFLDQASATGDASCITTSCHYCPHGKRHFPHWKFGLYLKLFTLLLAKLSDGFVCHHGHFLITHCRQSRDNAQQSNMAVLCHLLALFTHALGHYTRPNLCLSIKAIFTSVQRKQTEHVLSPLPTSPSAVKY